MADMIKIEFRQAFYSGDFYYEKGEVYDLPADTPIPSRDITILDGKSTYIPGAKGKSAPRVTRMQKDVAADRISRQKENAERE